MKKLDKVNPKDYRFVPVDPDPDFDPEHNRQVIEYTIKKQDELWRKKQREFAEGARERAWAISHYVEAEKMGNQASVNQFFGDKYLNYLKGQEILDRYKKEAMKQAQLNPNGQLIKQIKNFYAETKSQRRP